MGDRFYELFWWQDISLCYALLWCLSSQQSKLTILIQVTRISWLHEYKLMWSSIMWYLLIRSNMYSVDKDIVSIVKYWRAWRKHHCVSSRLCAKEDSVSLSVCFMFVVFKDVGFRGSSPWNRTHNNIIFAYICLRNTMRLLCFHREVINRYFITRCYNDVLCNRASTFHLVCHATLPRCQI